MEAVRGSRIYLLKVAILEMSNDPKVRARARGTKLTNSSSPSCRCSSAKALPLLRRGIVRCRCNCDLSSDSPPGVVRGHTCGNQEAEATRDLSANCFCQVELFTALYALCGGVAQTHRIDQQSVWHPLRQATVKLSA